MISPEHLQNLYALEERGQTENARELVAFFVAGRKQRPLCSGRRKRLKLPFSAPFLCFVSFGAQKK